MYENRKSILWVLNIPSWFDVCVKSVCCIINLIATLVDWHCDNKQSATPIKLTFTSTSNKWNQFIGNRKKCHTHNNFATFYCLLWFSNLFLLDSLIPKIDFFFSWSTVLARTTIAMVSSWFWQNVRMIRFLCIKQSSWTEISSDHKSAS